MARSFNARCHNDTAIRASNRASSVNGMISANILRNAFSPAAFPTDRSIRSLVVSSTCSNEVCRISSLPAK